MILDIDLGNSRIKWRTGAQPEILNTFALGEELPSQWQNLGSCDRVRLASVRSPATTAAFLESVQRQSGALIQVAQVLQGFGGLQLAYANVSGFGVDRWLAMLAARARYPGRDCVVISGGTALTADLVTAQGIHLGGYIAPGWRSAARALWQNTDGLKDARGDLAPRLSPGTTTLECIAAGLTALFRGFLNELCLRAVGELAQPQWVFTGGDAERMMDFFVADRGQPQSVVRVPGLVLEGLAVALP